MNLVILEDSDFTDGDNARLTGRRLQHLRDVQKIQTGDTIRAGRINGAMGTATVIAINDDSLELHTDLAFSPPPPLPLTMILALPRPKMLRRILQTIASMGVKKLYLINSYRVEKSYWQTPWLADDMIRAQLVLGLEQSMDTRLPEVILKKRFKPFVEDELTGICRNTTGLVAHPKGQERCPVDLPAQTAVTLAIGPEGGFINYEVEKLSAAGLKPVTLGNRILRVETAVPAILGRLYPSC
ncbi:MAG: 16S rRNA (uracil(1498)-N(3))-methyltransferase [Pseudomonadales bacterium]|nr:16S rRNA (uracil(1498)-N(3))-methyltransferase [Pseudomonadales bacterium]